MASSAKNKTFPFLDPAEEQTLLAASNLRDVAAEEVVLDQGVSLHALFVIQSGSLRVERMDGDMAIPLATMYEGEFFGEMSFVDGDPTSARVIADEPTRLLIIEEAVIGRMTTQHPGFDARLYRSIAAMLAQRLRLREMRMYADQSWG